MALGGVGGVKRVYKSVDVAQPSCREDPRVQYLPARLDCGPFSAFSFWTRNRSCRGRSSLGIAAYEAGAPASLSHSTLPAPRDSTNATVLWDIALPTDHGDHTSHRLDPVSCPLDLSFFFIGNKNKKLLLS